MDWPEHPFSGTTSSISTYTDILLMLNPYGIPWRLWKYFVQQALITFYEYIVIYGTSGVLLWSFGSRDVWNVQANMLGSMNDGDAVAYRDSVQSAANSIGVAGAIVAQVAITALSLPFLSQAHWVARALWIFSLISGIMTVYYSVKQQKVMSHLLYPHEIKDWVRGIELHTIVAAMTIPNRKPQPRWFLPGVPSVLAVSAPELLMSASLASLIVGLGVYVGFVWHRKLDTGAGANDSLGVFIVYIVSITISYLVYSLSIIAQSERVFQRPRAIAERNFVTWRVNGTEQSMHNHPPLRDLNSPNGGTAPGELAELFRNSARLRKESAENDEGLARYYQQQA